jgi:hypothetical protein
MVEAVVSKGQIWKHRKGTHYRVLHIGTHTEIGEELVIYTAVGGSGKVWVRPLEMFMDGRFEYLQG